MMRNSAMSLGGNMLSRSIFRGPVRMSTRPAWGADSGALGARNLLIRQQAGGSRQTFSSLPPTSKPRQSGGVFGTWRAAFRSSRASSFFPRRSRLWFSSTKGSGESLSLRERMRKLSREYGWTTVGVYLGLSVLDFPFCFLLVRVVGTDRIAELEHWLVSNVKRLIPQSLKDWWHEYREALREAETETFGNNDISHDVEMVGWGVKEAEERNQHEASLATQLALAYAIHKSFIFVRIPLTAAVTPKVVKVLRSWGWRIGKRPVKSP